MVMPLRSQQGVALLTVLLLVVSITVVAGSMLASQKIAIRRSSLLLNQDKLLQAIDAGEQLAMTIIRADNQLNDTDSLQDIWAQPSPPFSLGNYSISVGLRDEAARFNINNLYYDNAVDGEALSVFERLLTQLNLEPEIAIAVLDWQDSDSEVYKDGGDEQTVYAGSGSLSNSSLSNDALPNQPFITIEQLAKVRGVDAEVLASLRPFITAVPYYLPINVNTASPVVLASLVNGATSEQMQTLVDQRDKQVVASIDDLWQLPPLNALSAEQQQAIAPLLAVDSTAFMALMTATDNGSEGNIRQRYATVLISNREVGNTDNNSANNAANNNANTAGNNSNSANNSNSTSSNSANDTKSAKEVKIVSQRLWAFRPNF
ncbi:MAG: type II secretion system minor pseudopilin GspK [Psychrobacter sp.]|nr:type II secretion system minor pseudopilin GspK [Psychrobacter sp.]